MNGFSSLLDRAWDWSAETLELAIVAAGSAALLGVLVAAINVFGRRWLSARQMGVLWGLVLVRLALPCAPASSVSLQRLWPEVQVETGQPSDEVLPSGTRYADAPADPAPTTHYYAAPTPDDAPGDSLSFVEDLLNLTLPFVWLFGAVAALLGAVIVQWRFCRGLKHVPASDDARLSGLWKSCCQLAGVRREVPILLTASVDQPAVMGLFRARLLLPEDAIELRDEQLRMVMLHELAHVRRWHVAVNWALVVVRAVHWWNPVYWLATARFQSLREQACDAFALERLGGGLARDYGDLLLSLAGRRQPRTSWLVVLPASLLGLFSTFFRKRDMRNRLDALRTTGVKRGRWHTTAVTTLVTLAAACGLTDAGTPESAPRPAVDWLPQVHDWNAWGSVAEMATSEPVTRTYDVAKVLQRIAEDERTIDAAQVLKCVVISFLGGYEPDRDHPATAKMKPGYAERVAIDGATLRVDARPGVHAEIERSLQAWEQGGLVQICIETRFITDERDIASALGVSWDYLEASEDDHGEVFSSESNGGAPVVRAKAGVSDYVPITVANLGSEQAHQFIEAAQQGRRANLVQAPKITLINGQRASVFDVTHTPFVVGLEKGKGERRAKVDVIDEGIKLTFCATQDGDASKIRLEARAELSEISDVRTATTLLAGKPNTIQLPRVKRCRIDVCSEVADGDSLLVGCIPTYEQNRFFYLLLTVRRLHVAQTDD
jgi:beta-lactamase regulating signal transducer with metallopeptidase domain